MHELWDRKITRPSMVFEYMLGYAYTILPRCWNSVSEEIDVGQMNELKEGKNQQMVGGWSRWDP